MNGLFNNPHTIAGLWFAVAQLLPVTFAYLSFDGLKPFGPPALVGFPLAIVIAGLCGFWLGSDILSPSKINNPTTAKQWGFIISFISFFLFVLIASLLNYSRFGTSLFILLGYGLVLVGWLIAIVGVIAGGLLYTMSRRAA